MGGYGSGRSGDRVYTSDVLNLSVSTLKRLGYLGGEVISMSGTLHWNRGGERISSVSCETSLNRLTLRYKANEQSINDTIRLEETPCNYGGSRKWFTCPHCGKRVGVLYLRGSLFRCRDCQGLHYASQSESSYDRIARRVHKVRDKLGNDGALLARKPKGMHWKTFERLWKQELALEEQIDRIFLSWVQNMSREVLP